MNRTYKSGIYLFGILSLPVIYIAGILEVFTNKTFMAIILVIVAVVLTVTYFTKDMFLNLLNSSVIQRLAEGFMTGYDPKANGVSDSYPKSPHAYDVEDLPKF